MLECVHVADKNIYTTDPPKIPNQVSQVFPAGNKTAIKKNIYTTPHGNKKLLKY